MTSTLRITRGNTIPETALVISLVLLVTFGIVQYALVGFNQLGADGATFVGDHAAVAYYQGPTAANAKYAQQIGSANFPHASTAFTAYVPANHTYELRSNTSYASHNFFGQFFPSTIAAHSRIVEPSASTTGNTTTGNDPSTCVTAAEQIAYGTGMGAQNILSKTVTLPGGVTFTNGVQGAINGVSTGAQQLYNIVPDKNGNAAISYTNGTLSTELNAINAINTDFQTTVTGLKNINTVLRPFGALATPLEQGISSQLSPLLNTAVGGTYTNGATITVIPPLPVAQFSAQISTSSTAITTLENSNLLGGLLSSALTTVVNPALSSIDGALSDMNVQQNTLNALNAVTPTCQ
jgi:hypothetical protein